MQSITQDNFSFLDFLKLLWKRKPLIILCSLVFTVAFGALGRDAFHREQKMLTIAVSNSYAACSTSIFSTKFLHKLSNRQYFEKWSAQKDLKSLSWDTVNGSSVKSVGNTELGSFLVLGHSSLGTLPFYAFPDQAKQNPNQQGINGKEKQQFHLRFQIRIINNNVLEFWALKAHSDLDKSVLDDAKTAYKTYALSVFEALWEDDRAYQRSIMEAFEETTDADINLDFRVLLNSENCLKTIENPSSKIVLLDTQKPSLFFLYPATGFLFGILLAMVGTLVHQLISTAKNQ